MDKRKCQRCNADADVDEDVALGEVVLCEACEEEFLSVYCKTIFRMIEEDINRL